MNTQTSTNQESYSEDILLSPEAMQNIYVKLSIPEETSFDILQENKFIEQCIDEYFDTKFKQIETKVLQENIELLNNSFVQLLKFCLTKKFNKAGLLFIGYCDYFDLDYNKTFISLHEKLQKLIIHTCKCLVGSKCYDKHKEKLCGNTKNIQTLFDLYQK